MELEEVRIEESGDAIYRVDMDDREQKAFIELGIQFAMICGAAGVSTSDVFSDLLDKISKRQDVADQAVREWEQNSATAE